MKKNEIVGLSLAGRLFLYFLVKQNLKPALIELILGDESL
jgi:hypothetical protein